MPKILSWFILIATILQIFEGQNGQIANMAEIFNKIALFVNYVGEYHTFGI